MYFFKKYIYIIYIYTNCHLTELGDSSKSLGFWGFWRLPGVARLLKPKPTMGPSVLHCWVVSAMNLLSARYWLKAVVMSGFLFVSLFNYWSCWWFQVFLILIPIWGRFPCWLIFFNCVGSTTNQWFFAHLNSCGPFFLKNHVLGSFWLEHVGLKSHIGNSNVSRPSKGEFIRIARSLSWDQTRFFQHDGYPISPPCAKLPNRGT